MSKLSDRPKIRLLTCLGVGLGLSILALLVAGGLVWNSLVLRHERAAQVWDTRKPPHYVYTVQVHNSFWTTRVQIEVLRGKIMGVIDLNTGQPANFLKMVPGSYLHTTNGIFGYLLIDQLFDHIELTHKTPRTWKAFVAKTNPEMYQMAAMNGWVDYYWMGCERSYPKVAYNKTFGYPERLRLSGTVCTTNMELMSPIEVWIESFQVLP